VIASECPLMPRALCDHANACSLLLSHVLFTRNRENAHESCAMTVSRVGAP
jgi:hypothetical protein